jgi:hypothetical protein
VPGGYTSGKRHIFLQDQASFEQRRGREHGRNVAFEAAIPHADVTPEEEPTELLHSAAATMMTETARNLLLSGDRQEGLKAYKERIYRKMDATDDERVCCPPCLFCALMGGLHQDFAVVHIVRRQCSSRVNIPNFAP